MTKRLIAGVVGVAVMLAYQFLGLDLSGQEEAIVDILVTVLTVAGVAMVQDKPKA